MTAPLKIAALGLDTRAQNLFRMFFRGPCENQAAMVDHEKEADAFLIDLDTQQGAKLLAQQRENHPDRILILLSVKEQVFDKGTVFVKKPAQAQSMIAAIEKARALVKTREPKEKASRFGWPFSKSQAQRSETPPPGTTKNNSRTITASVQQEVPLPTSTMASKQSAGEPPNDHLVTPPSAMKVIARPDNLGKAVHKVAMLLDEQGFKNYLGHRDDIDPSNSAQLATVLYDPKDFLQGHLQSAIKIAYSRKEAVRLETPWKNITILPEQRLVYLAADEAQVRAACAIPFRNIVGLDVDSASMKQAVNIKPVGQEELEEILDSPYLMRLDAFLWKIALFTSKGRLPKNVDIQQAFFLKRWPGMTRLLLSPHAMRIAALLVQKPYSLFDASHKLGVRQQYVFAFVSAAHALGLIGQQAIPVEVEPLPEEEKPVAATQPERKSLFKKILSRLKLV